LSAHFDFFDKKYSPMRSEVMDSIKTMVPMALIVGLIPPRIMFQTLTGRVSSNPHTNHAMMNSSKDKVKVSRKAAMIPGIESGKITSLTVCQAFAPRSLAASSRLGWMVRNLARMMNIAKGAPKTVWLMMTEKREFPRERNVLRKTSKDKPSRRPGTVNGPDIKPTKTFSALNL